jgi:hypothetical protein
MMSSARTVSRKARAFSLQDMHAFAATDESQTKFYFEDGWVFREHHGKYVECICRFEDIQVANLFQPSFGQTEAGDPLNA